MLLRSSQVQQPSSTDSPSSCVRVSLPSCRLGFGALVAFHTHAHTRTHTHTHTHTHHTDPGLCNKSYCPTSFTYDVVVPADPSDPLLTNWTKPSYNPIVNGTGDDPSTAWKTPSGEWRLIGNQGCTTESGAGGAPIYGSMDFKTWYKVLRICVHILSHLPSC
jgi:hypothetical protein